MIEYSVQDNALVCAFQGRMDTANCQMIGDELSRKVAEARLPVIFDLQNVDYVSSMFLSLCLKIFKQVGTGNLSLRHIQPNVKKVLKIANLDALIGPG